MGERRSVKKMEGTDRVGNEKTCRESLIKGEGTGNKRQEGEPSERLSFRRDNAGD